MRRFLLLLVAVGVILPPPAGAAIVTRQDAAGRTITFDVPAGTNVNRYAAVLRRTLHGDEIESVTIRFASRAAVARSCGGAHLSCYVPGWRDEGEVLIPVGGTSTEYVLLHEYAHHLDASYGLTNSWRSGPAAVRWWAARRIEQRLRRGVVTWDYELGWQRSIGEIFAEDYVQLHARPRYGIRWLQTPNRLIRAGLRLDVREALSEFGS